MHDGSHEKNTITSIEGIEFLINHEPSINHFEGINLRLLLKAIDIFY
jgi:hypothetical protein